MRRKYYPGEAVPAGTYWNSKSLEMATISEDDENLPAGEGVTYYRAPLPLVLLLGPLVGLAFVIFLPFAVPAIAIHALATRAWRATPWAARQRGAGAKVRSGR
ncbi:MAG: hypothetical protein Q8P22_01730 [Chloroflexota bacterium]|nr:hypothetical protein [Chloroflexota bacterium]